MPDYNVDWEDLKKWANKDPELKKQYAEIDKPENFVIKPGKNVAIGETILQRLKMQYIKEKKSELYWQMVKQVRKEDVKTKFVELLGGKCLECGFNKHFCALEFHHKNPKDKWSKNTFSGYLEDPVRFEKDIKEGKILLLCANCHKIEHFNKHRAHRASFKYKEHKEV